MNWKDLMQIPGFIIALMLFFPIINHLLGELFPVLDAVDPSRVLFVVIIKIILAAIPLVIVWGFLRFVARAVTEPAQPQYIIPPPRV